jgi:hypothetical protein
MCLVNRQAVPDPPEFVVSVSIDAREQCERVPLAGWNRVIRLVRMPKEAAEGERPAARLATGIQVIDHMDFWRLPSVRDAEHVVFRLAETLGHRELRVAGKILIAKDQYMMRRECIESSVPKDIVERLRQIDVPNFRARDVGKSSNVDDRSRRHVKLHPDLLNSSPVCFQEGD